MTKRDFYVAVMESEVAEELKEFAQKEIAAMDKRNANRKPSKTQVANEALKERIVEVMTGAKPMTATDVLKALGDDDLSNQKVSALLKALGTEGKVVKTIEKRKSYFALAE